MNLQPYSPPPRRTVMDLNLAEWVLIQIKFFKSVNNTTKFGIVFCFISGTVTVGTAFAALTMPEQRTKLIYAYAQARPVPTAIVKMERDKPAKKWAAKNPQAPAIPLKYDAEEYIQKYKKIAQDEERRSGIPASITLAQGLVESRGGTSTLAVQNNNHFGLKCFSRNCKKGHCTNHTDDTHKDFFLKFKTAEQSFRQHTACLKKPRYARLFKSRDYRRWASGLESCGYATDRSYAEALIKIIQTYELYKFD